MKKEIQISSLHLSFERSHLLWNLSEEGIKYWKDIKQAIDDAYFPGTEIIVMHSEGIIPDRFKASKTLQDLFEYV